MIFKCVINSGSLKNIKRKMKLDLDQNQNFLYYAGEYNSAYQTETINSIIFIPKRVKIYSMSLVKYKLIEIDLF